MIEVHPRLWVGDDGDAESWLGMPVGWPGLPEVRVVISAAKDPYHRALVGYTGRAAPEGPDRYSAKRGRHLALNWVDVDEPSWFRRDEYDLAEDMIRAAQLLEVDCLVHCNAGVSRSPALVLLWLHRNVFKLNAGVNWDVPLLTAEAMFQSLYPRYAPQPGIRGFIEAMW